MVLDSRPELLFPGKTREMRESYVVVSELGLGTIVQDSRMWDGLSYVIEREKDTSDIKGFIAISGAIPRLPEFYGILNAQDMQFLGRDYSKIPRKEFEEWCDTVKERMKTEGKTVNDDELAEFLESVKYTITSKSEAAEVARKELKKITAVLPKRAKRIYVEGEEDHWNKKELEEIKIGDYLESSATLERLNKKIEQKGTQVGLLGKLVDELGKRKGSKWKTVLGEIIENVKSDKEKDKKELVKTLENYRDKKTNGEDVSKEKIVRKIDAELERDRTRLRDYESDLNAMMREQEALGFFRITKRRAIEADQRGVLYELTKREYVETLYQALPGFEIHPETQADIKIGKKKLRLYHNSAQLSNRSKAVSQSAQRNRLSDSKRDDDDYIVDYDIEGGHNGPLKVQVERKNIQAIKETTVFATVPTFQSSKKLEDAIEEGIDNVHTKRYFKGNFGSGAVIFSDGKYDEQEVDFWSDERLIELGELAGKREELRAAYSETRKRDEKSAIKTDIEKIEKKLDDLYTYNYLTLIHTSDLHLGAETRLNESPRTYKEKIERYIELENGIGKEREKLNGDQSQKARTRSENRIEGFYEEEKKVFHDIVYGFEPWPLEVLKREARYLEETLIPELEKSKTHFIATGDMMHGNHFPGASDRGIVLTHNLTPYLKYIEESDLPQDKKISLLSSFCVRINEAATKGTLSAQREMAKYSLVPLMDILRRNGATINIASGDHYNKSTKRGSALEEESTDLISLLPPADNVDKSSYDSYVECLSKNEDNTTIGENSFMGGVNIVRLGKTGEVGNVHILDGHKFYASHKAYGRGRPDWGKVMTQFRKNFPLDFVYAAFGHNHRPSLTYVGKTIYGMATGHQSGNEYCDDLGIAYSPHGFNILKTDPDRRGHFRMKFVLDRTLDKYAEVISTFSFEKNGKG